MQIAAVALGQTHTKGAPGRSRSRGSSSVYSELPCRPVVRTWRLSQLPLRPAAEPRSLRIYRWSER